MPASGSQTATFPVSSDTTGQPERSEGRPLACRWAPGPSVGPWPVSGSLACWWAPGPSVGPGPVGGPRACRWVPGLSVGSSAAAEVQPAGTADPCGYSGCYCYYSSPAPALAAHPDSLGEAGFWVLAAVAPGRGNRRDVGIRDHGVCLLRSRQCRLLQLQ